VTDVRPAILATLRDPQFGLDIDIERSATLIAQYLNELYKWNKKINLTSEKDEPSILAKHIYDSLQYSRAVRRGGRILDIGSGAGFPGLPLKIIFPDCQIVLVESRRKRASFLSSAIRKLGLTGIEVCNKRAEELWEADNFAGQFDYVLFRAVSAVKDCLILGGPFVNEGGRIIIKKEPGVSAGSLGEGSSAMRLDNTIPILNHGGQKSELLVFAKCST